MVRAGTAPVGLYFPAATSGGSQLFVIPPPGHQVLWISLGTNSQTQLHRHSYTQFRDKLNLEKEAIMIMFRSPFLELHLSMTCLSSRPRQKPQGTPTRRLSSSLRLRKAHLCPRQPQPEDAPGSQAHSGHKASLNIQNWKEETEFDTEEEIPLLRNSPFKEEDRTQPLE